MIRRPPRSTLDRSSAASDVYKRQVFVPIGQWDNRALRNRGAALGLHGIGRLKPGVSVEQGEADLDRVMSDLAVAYPATNKGHGSTVSSLKSRIVGGIGPILW